MWKRRFFGASILRNWRNCAGVCGRGEANRLLFGIGGNRALVSGDIEEKADHLATATFLFFKGCGQYCGSIGGDQFNMSPVAEQEELERVRSKTCLLDRIGRSSLGSLGMDVSAKGKEGRMAVVA